jgi:hypothetical protein
MGDGELPQKGSLSEFITEHYWGYAAQRTGGTVEYQVEHPQWHVNEAKHARFAGNAEEYYGPAFAEVLKHAPDSAFLADGSEVTVFKGVQVG